MGGIYSLGISPGTRLRYNLIHDVLSYDYGGWGLYTDEGSTGILMENNVVYRTKDGCFHQHYGRENVVRNNIYCEPAPPLGGNWSNGNYRFDHNLYWNPGGPPKFPGDLSLKQWQEKGQDVHSMVADPGFIDADNFDFRLEADSPALKLGFQPIDIRTAGLMGPAEWVELPGKVQRPPLKLPGEK